MVQEVSESGIYRERTPVTGNADDRDARSLSDSLVPKECTEPRSQLGRSTHLSAFSGGAHRRSAACMSGSRRGFVV
jgi:hypothetical protein